MTKGIKWELWIQDISISWKTDCNVAKTHKMVTFFKQSVKLYTINHNYQRHYASKINNGRNQEFTGHCYIKWDRPSEVKADLHPPSQNVIKIFMKIFLKKTTTNLEQK